MPKLLVKSALYSFGDAEYTLISTWDMFELGVIELILTGYPFSLSHFMVPEAWDDFSVHLQRHRFNKSCHGPRSKYPSFVDKHLFLMFGLLFRVRLRSKTAVMTFCQQMSPKLSRVFGHSLHIFFFPSHQGKTPWESCLSHPSEKYPDHFPFKADPSFVFFFLNYAWLKFCSFWCSK